MMNFIGKTIILMIAIILTLYIVKLNNLEPGIRVRYYEFHPNDREWKW